MSQPTLRDVKRAATHAGMARAALRLASERGLDGFTIDDVVTEAGYSRRTFANHFTSKEDAVVAAPFIGFEDLDLLAGRLPERVHLNRLVRAVEEWPAPIEDGGEPGRDDEELTSGQVVDALERIVLSPIIVDTLIAAERLTPLVAANPSLLPALLARKNTIGETINRLLARIDGIEGTTAFLPILLGALSGALTSFDDMPGNLCPTGIVGQDVAGHHERIRVTFGYLRHGFSR